MCPICRCTAPADRPTATHGTASALEPDRGAWVDQRTASDERVARRRCRRVPGAGRVVTGLSVWAAAQFAYFLVNAIFWMTRNEDGPPLSGALEVWNQWDTGHYVSIAAERIQPGHGKPGILPALFDAHGCVGAGAARRNAVRAGSSSSWIACVAALTADLPAHR